MNCSTKASRPSKPGNVFGNFHLLDNFLDGVPLSFCLDDRHWIVEATEFEFFRESIVSNYLRVPKGRIVMKVAQE